MKAKTNPMFRMNNLVLNIMEAEEKRESSVYKILIVRCKHRSLRRDNFLKKKYLLIQNGYLQESLMRC